MIGYGAFLIAVLVVVSGVIAYVGDVLGRWLGRRRVTLFGLRPRRTAMVISVFAGMLIAAWTIGVSMAVSQDVRDGLTRVVALRRQIGSLKASARVLVRQNKELKDQERALREEADSSRQAAEQARADRQKAEKTLAAAEKALARADKELARRKARLARLSSDLADKKKQLERATEAAIKRGAEVIFLTRQTTRLNAERTRLNEEIQELTGWRARAMTTFAHIYTAPLIAQAGEPLLDVIVDAAAGKTAVRRALGNLISRLKKIADSRGAEGSDEQGALIVQLAVADQERKKVTLYEQDAVLDLLAKAISDMGGSVIVRALSIGNTVKGEPILADFQLFRNRQVFRQGEVIAEATVDGSLSQAKVLAALVDLLRNEVGMRARQQGVLPAVQQGPGGRTLFPAPGMPVGEVSMETLLSLADTIRQKGGPVRVIARAARDTWTAGPVGVELSMAAS